MGEAAGSLLIGWASESPVPDRPALLRGMGTARVGKGVHDPITVATPVEKTLEIIHSL